MDYVSDIVLSYPKLQERFQEKSNERMKALKYLNEIKADYSKTYIKAFEKILDTTLPQIYDGINFNENGVDVSQLVKNNCVVFVPNHQSHADYLAMNYMVFKEYQIPLYVAGGKNLNIFPIGTLFRKSGCFFIRRSFQNDILYKLVLEGYLYYLLMEKKPIEFFFEGGRSRTGKLLPPRHGLYHMLLEAHRALPEGKKGELTFIPVSINHEYVPEQQSLVKENKGAKKTKESTLQLLGLLGIFSHQFGSIHINLGTPLVARAPSDPRELKGATQKLAFSCFLEVGRNMVVTPSSLLAFILLDTPDGAYRWDEIRSRAIVILNYCHDFQVPVTSSLQEGSRDESLQRALDIFIANKKVQVIGDIESGPSFYSIKKEARSELLYFKNSILHHFLVPWGITSAWLSLFSGEIENVRDLQHFFVERRSQLKHEFYLPSTKEFLIKTLKTISQIVGREVRSLDQCLELSHKDLYKIASSLGVFSRSMNTIFEAYFLSALTMKKMLAASPGGFKREEYLKSYGETFEKEKKLARVVKYPESYSVAIAKSALNYFEHGGYIENRDGHFFGSDRKLLSDACRHFEDLLHKTLALNLLPPQEGE